MRIMAISDLHGNLEGLDLKGAAAGLLQKQGIFRFGNCLANRGFLLKRSKANESYRKVLIRG